MDRGENNMQSAVAFASLKATRALIKKYNLPRKEAFNLHADVFADAVRETLDVEDVDAYAVVEIAKMQEEDKRADEAAK